MNTTATLASLDEYLNSAYEPDREFVDGVILERNVGTQRHSRLQALLTIFFGQWWKSHRLAVFTEARLLVDAASGRHRIPDVMVLNVPYQKGRVVVDVPAIIVEVKSPDDTFDDLMDRCFDYEKLAVANVIVMDPDNKRAWLVQRGDWRLLSGAAVQLTVSGQLMDFPFARLFEELDEA